MKNLKFILLALVHVVFLVNSAQAHYDPNIGRWLSRDPIMEEGGVNLYGFCFNQPAHAIDALGSQVFLTPMLDPVAEPLLEPMLPRFIPRIVPRVIPEVEPGKIIPITPPTPIPIPYIPPVPLIIPPPLPPTPSPMPIPENGTGPNGYDPQLQPPGSPDPYKLPDTKPGPKRGGGGCNPCPPNSPAWEVNEPGHGGCKTHWHWIEYNQNPITCECHATRRDSGTKP